MQNKVDDGLNGFQCLEFLISAKVKEQADFQLEASGFIEKYYDAQFLLKMTEM